MTSDRPPKEIATLEDRLRTRFEGGMIADIQPPDVETKIAILKRKAMDRKCSVSEDVLEFLANDSGHDVRTLEGRLNKVIFASRLHEEPISLALAKRALSEAVNTAEEQEDVTPEKIIAAACSYFKQKAIRENVGLVVGLAKGYSEAKELIVSMIEEALRETGSANVKEYILNSKV